MLPVLNSASVVTHDQEKTELWGAMPDPKAIPTWKAGQNGISPAPPAKALPIDYRSMFTSDMFAVMSDTCCRTIFFPPGHGVRLPMDFELDGPFAKRIRNFVANRNSFLFNGADRLSFLQLLPSSWAWCSAPVSCLQVFLG